MGGDRIPGGHAKDKAMLGLSQCASVGDVRQGYRKLAFRAHPDKAGGVLASSTLRSMYNALHCFQDVLETLLQLH